MVVQCINRATTRSLPMAKLMVPLVRFQHQHLWLASSKYFRKKLMDSVRGSHGFTADQASRTSTRPSLWDRGLPMELYYRLLEELGFPPEFPVIDMFTCSRTAKSPRFVSRFAHQDNLWTDALDTVRYPWSPDQNPKIQPGDLLYCFPPPKLIPNVLANVRNYRSSSVLLVARYGSTLPITEMMLMSTGPPVFLPVSVNDLEHPDGPHAPPLDGATMTLIAMHLSASACDSGDTLIDPSQTVWPVGGIPDRVSRVPTTIRSGSTGAISSAARALHRSILGLDSLPGGQQ